MVASLTRFAVAGAIVVGLASATSAQGISGEVLDKYSGEPLVEAMVVLHPSFDARRDTTITTSAGRYWFAAPPGQYIVEVRHVAYETQFSRLLTVRENLGISANFVMEPAIVYLGEVDVEAARPLPHMERGGYYDRRAAGVGRMIEREEILRRRPSSLTDLFRGMPGIIVDAGDIRLQSIRDRTCWPTLVLDDVPLRMRGERLGFRLDGIIKPEFIEAIEIHRRTTGLPSRYGGRNSPCGVILIWSRRSLR